MTPARMVNVERPYTLARQREASRRGKSVLSEMDFSASAQKEAQPGSAKTDEITHKLVDISGRVQKGRDIIVIFDVVVAADAGRGVINSSQSSRGRREERRDPRHS